MIVDVCQRVSKHSGNYSKISDYASSTNIYIAHPKPKNPKDGTYQHLIVEIPKKAKLSLQKSGTNDSIKDLTESTQDKDYLNFSGAEYTLYKKPTTRLSQLHSLTETVIFQKSNIPTPIRIG